jgi:hypothetical protein
MNPGYIALFEQSHQEQLLIPIADIVKKIREDGVSLYCLKHFHSPHIAALDGNMSCAYIQGDRFKPRSIFINIEQVTSLATHCNLDYNDCLTAVLLHEWGHVKLADRGGSEASLSESDAWDKAWEIAEALSPLSPADFANLRGYCQWHRNPTLHTLPIDSRPQWLKDFDRLAPQLGYPLAWRAVMGSIKSLGLQPWQVLQSLQDNGFDFEIAYDLSENENIESALLQLAIRRNDVAELARVAKPTSAKHIPPEQPLPPGSVG